MEANAFLEALYNANYERLYIYAENLLFNAAYAEEAVQETFFEAVRKQDALMRHAKPEAWLMETLKNKIRVGSRRRALEALYFISLEQDLAQESKKLAVEDRPFGSISELLDAIRALLPPEDYAPSSINVLGDWVYFSNFRDGFSLWRVRTDGSEAEKLVDGYCYTFLVAESGIYFDCRDENNVMRTFHAELDGSAQTLLYESCAPTTYYEGKLYLYDFRSGTLYAYNTEANEREILFEGKYDAAFFSADDTGIYFWDDMCDYCHLDPETKEITVLHQGPIGDYFNYYDGTVYYVAYGGENYDYDCCYAMDVETGEQKAILSLSPEMYDAFGDPIGITQVDYRNGNYDADSIPTNEEGWPMALNELVDGLFVVNGQVFARGRLARTGMAEIWVFCDGASGAVWG